MRIRNKLKRLRQIDWHAVGWAAVGYLLLAFCTSLFALACLRGRQAAAVQLLLFCTLLLIVLPPRR
jgi:hypothetical protein